MKLYKFFWDAGRMGEVESLFIEDEKLVKEVIGKRIYFGEILGKHSEIYGVLEKGDLTVISKDKEVIDRLISLFKEDYEGCITLCGHNPISYYLSVIGDDEGAEYERLLRLRNK